MKEMELNRKKYNEIKKMDHNTMKMFCNSVYCNGYKDGVAEAPKGITVEAVSEAMSNVKGIGEKKAALVIEHLRSLC